MEKPSPKLMALKDPYSFAQREDVPYQFDYSYYRGKYYLYWGPVPGLVFAGIEGISHREPPNALLTIISYIGLSFLLSVILAQIRDQFFPAGPGSSPGIFILSGLVNIPLLFLLGRPEVYETSIIAGQFFLFAGLANWMMYSKTGKPFWLAAAGLGWGLAIGSRYNLAISILLFVGFAVVWIGQERRGTHFWPDLGCLLAPLALCVLGLGIYNFARFRNPLETGLTYQLTVPVRHYFLGSYLPSNLYAYLFYPLTVVDKFPFVRATLYENAGLPPWLGAVSVKAGNQFDPVMVGLLSSSPSMWLLALGIPLAVLLARSDGRQPVLPPGRFAFFAVILIASLAQLLFLLVYYYGAVRYLADVYLLLTLIVAMLVWRTDEMLRSRPRLRVCFWVMVVGLGMWTAGIGFFGGFDIPPQIFLHSNAALYSHLAQFWNRGYDDLKTILDILWIPKVLRFVLPLVGYK